MLANKYILFFHAYDNITSTMSHIVKVLQQNGAKVDKVTNPKNWHLAGGLVGMIRKADYVVIWHGGEPGCWWMRRVCTQLNKPWWIAENGLLPQKGYFHFDSDGIGSSSSLCQDLYWVTDEHMTQYEEHRERHLGTKGWNYEGGGGYVVAPLQLIQDSTIYLDSPFRSMRAYIDHVVTLASPLPVIVTPHPKDKGFQVKSKGVTVERARTTMDMAQHAEKVIGINSTVLYETAMLGCPTKALGDGPFLCHQTEGTLDKLLAACVVRQIPIQKELDITPWAREVA